MRVWFHGTITNILHWLYQRNYLRRQHTVWGDADTLNGVNSINIEWSRTGIISIVTKYQKSSSKCCSAYTQSYWTDYGGLYRCDIRR